MKVYITDCDHDSINIEKEVLKSISKDVLWLNCLTEEDLIEQCQEADGLITQYAPFTRKVLRNLPNLKVIVRYGVGVDTIDINAASECGIQVCNVPDYGVNEVSDHAAALIMALTRKIVPMNQKVKNNEWDYQKSIPVYRIQNQTVGVLGLGRIGSALAEKMHGLGMNVIGFDPVRERRYLPSYIKPVPFEEMLKTADVISIHTPLTEQTSHYIGRKELQMMKKTAYIINTARGGLVDEDALLEALKKNQIAGAGIDVFEEEPPEENLELFQFDNFICTPHMAWYSEESSKELKRKAAEEVLRVLTHKEPEYPINKIPLKLF